MNDDEDALDNLMDQRGRMRRLVAAISVGLVLGAIAWVICDRLTAPDPQAFTNPRDVSRWRFNFYMTGFAFAGGLGVTLAILNARAKRRWRANRIPNAKQVS